MSAARWVPGIAKNTFSNESSMIVSGGYNTEVGPLDTIEIRTLNGWISTNTTIPSTVYSHCTMYINESTVILIGGVQPAYSYSPKTYFLTNGVWSNGPGIKLPLTLNIYCPKKLDNST
jgi:hypothetical protein